MSEVELHIIEVVPMVIDRGTEMGLSTNVATISGVGCEYRLYYDIPNRGYLTIMWPTIGTMKQRGEHLNSFQHVPFVPVPEGPGGDYRAWNYALSAIVQQAQDEIMHKAFVGVIASQN